MPLFDVYQTTSPSLSSGAIDVTFNKLEKVDYAIPTIDSSVDGSIQYSFRQSCATNVATITIYMQDASVNSGIRQVATTAMVNGRKLTVLGIKV